MVRSKIEPPTGVPRQIGASMKALITGGTGFLGNAIARILIARGDTVTLFARRPSLSVENQVEGHVDATTPGAEFAQGDIADPEAVRRAARDCDVVFHVAARVGGWGAYADYHQSNVEGTANVLAACRQHGISKLVYTSTPSVVHRGGDIEGENEDAPYAEHFDAPYPETKAIAERMVLAANDRTLSTVALRPHLVWGPGDRHLIPRLLDRARSGRLRLVGGGTKWVDATYIDNAAMAHVQAADRSSPEAACAGRAYFIAQGEPAPAHELINGVLDAAGFPPVTKSVSPRLAWLVGALAEVAYHALRRSDEPPLTRFAVRQLSTAHWFDLSAARRDLGYAPSITTAEGLERLRTAFESRRPTQNPR